MGIEALRQAEQQVQDLIATALDALAASGEGQQVYPEAAQTCNEAAEQGDIHRLHAARALATIASGGQMAQEFNQHLLAGLEASNIPQNETRTIRTTAQEAAALAVRIAEVAEAGAAAVSAQQDAPMILQATAGQISAATATGSDAAQHLTEAQRAAGRTIRGL